MTSLDLRLCTIYLSVGVGCWRNIYGTCLAPKTEKLVEKKCSLGASKAFKAKVAFGLSTINRVLSDCQRRLIKTCIRLDSGKQEHTSWINGIHTDSEITGMPEALAWNAANIHFSIIRDFIDISCNSSSIATTPKVCKFMVEIVSFVDRQYVDPGRFRNKIELLQNQNRCFKTYSCQTNERCLPLRLRSQTWHPFEHIGDNIWKVGNVAYLYTDQLKSPNKSFK